METLTTHSEKETEGAGERLASSLNPGTFVLLRGDLGAGKTAFVRGLAKGMGANADEVSNPTFVLIQHYRGRIPLVHVDLYRLDSAAAVDDLGLEELASGAVVAVEWAERLPRPIEGSVEVRLEDRGGDDRTITIARQTPEP